MDPNIAPAAPQPRLLLIKSATFAHTGKYALYGVPPRWHLLHSGKPAPKGAPVADVPHAAGQHLPATLAPDQVAALKYAPEKAAANKEMASFNDKHLPKLLEHAASGDATALLGMAFGTNSHAKKQVSVANFLLGQMGSPHKVVAGQAAGAHPAVQGGGAAAVLPAKPAAPSAKVPSAVAKLQQIDPAQVAGWLDSAKATPGKIPQEFMGFFDLATSVSIKKFHKWNAATKSTALHPALYRGAAIASLFGMHDQVLTHDGQWVLVKEAAFKGVASSDVVTDPAAIKSAAIAAKLGTAPSPVAPSAPAKPPRLIIPKNSAAPAVEQKSATAPKDVFHNTTDGHSKSWAIHVAPNASGGFDVVTEYGKIGGSQQSSSKPFPTQEAAQAAANKLKSAKTAKGYKLQFTDYGHKVNVSTPPADMGGWEFDPESAGFNGEPTLLFENDDATITYVVHTDDGEFQVGKLTADFQPDSHADFSDLSSAKEMLAIMGHSVPAAALQKLAQAAGVPLPGGDSGPKDGDTKQGADGMLVLKNGHWVKVDEPLTPASVPIPPFGTISPGKWGENYATVAIALKTAVESGGWGALKGAVVSHADGRFTINIAGFKLTKVGPSPDGVTGPQFMRRDAMHKFVAALKAAAGVKPKGAAKKAAAAPVAAPSPAGAIEAMDSWQQTGPQGGSNPGGRFKDADGVEWYCKFPADADTAKSEVLAAKLYAALGIDGQDAKLVTRDGKVGIASRWVSVSKAPTPAALAKADGVLSGFGADAWLGNWDVVGLGYDNLQISADGKAVRVDAGGSLEYRAQGGKKEFGPVVAEIDSLRDASLNPQAAKVFGKMTSADVSASVAKVVGLNDVMVRAIVNQYGPGDAAAKSKLADVLIARKADLSKRFPAAAKKKKAPVFKPDEITAPPSFLNWGDSGKPGPSSKDFLNEANDAAVRAIFAAAKTGSIAAIEALEAKVYDKESGVVTGSAKVLAHPSQHVKGYAQQVVNEIDSQLNPPRKFRFDGGHPLHALNAAYPAHHGAKSSAAVQKLAKFIVLAEPGTVSREELMLPPKVLHSEGGGNLNKSTYAKQSQAAFAKLPVTQQQALSSYTGSGYGSMNESLWAGNPSGAAKAAGAALHTVGHDVAPGTVLSRKISVHGNDLKDLLKSQGKLLMEPAIMSTSIRPSSWPGNVQLKLHVGPGVKGLWVGTGSKPNSGSISHHPGEDEILLPPGTRLLVMSVKSGADSEGFGKSSSHVIEAVILPS